MTRPSKSLISIALKEGTLSVGGLEGTIVVYTEGDLMVKNKEDDTYLVPVTTATGDNNIGVFVRCHGSAGGDLWYNNKYVTPKEVRDEVSVRWSKETPILLTCCYPAIVAKRYRKEFKKYRIHVLLDNCKELTWAGATPSQCVVVYTNEAHERKERRSRIAMM